MSKTVLFWLSLLLFVSGASILMLAWKYSRGIQGDAAPQAEIDDSGPPVRLVGEDEPWLKEFQLTERSERQIGTKDLAGKIHVVSFFFATCPASCKTQNHQLAGLVREFGEQGVKFLAITCDPETDSPAKLREYASTNFNAPRDSWYFLTGDLLYTRRIAAEIYEVSLDRKSHVEKFILVDQAGKIRGKYAWAEDRELQALKREIRELLKTGSETGEVLRETSSANPAEAEPKQPSSSSAGETKAEPTNS